MCVLLFAINQSDRYPVVLAANRDEFYERPSQAAHFWPDHPEVLAGRDDIAHGSWLGLSRSGRFAAVTNHAGSNDFAQSRHSRGDLVREYLTGSQDTQAFLRELDLRQHLYNGYGIVLGELPDLHYRSNRGGRATSLDAGIFGLGNDVLDSSWPRVEAGKRRLAEHLASDGADETERLFEILSDATLPSDADGEIPLANLDLSRPERLPLFVRLREYGTRCSTVVTVDSDGTARFEERTFSPASNLPVSSRRFSFSLDFAKS